MSQIVPPSQIEAQLERIWNSFQGTNKMRACLFNLIIYTKKSDRTTYLTTIAQKVIEKFPSRVLFITHDVDETKEELKTAVSVLMANEGKSSIACDLIEIAVSQKNVPRIPFVILPHILPDLPIYLVYADDPITSSIAEKFSHLPNRIIFDSDVTENLREFALKVIEKKEKEGTDVADLNWARIGEWRQLFAHIFKSKEDLNLLESAENIEITFNAHPTKALCHTKTQSIYLQTWLACQLGWKLQQVNQKGEALLFSYQTATSSVKVTLQPSEMSRVLPGRPLEISIQGQEGYHYHFHRNPDHPHHVIIEKSTPASCALPTTFIFEQDVSGKSLVSEICHEKSSEHYLSMLAKLAQMDSNLLCL